MREFREYFASTYEANRKIAARIGVTVKTFAEWLSGDRQPTGESLEMLRKFLDAEARRTAGDGIRPTERVPLKSCCCPDSCTTLGFVRSAERSGAGSASWALLRFKASARSAGVTPLPS
jgi:transcriptional regulator with XRE-family HTH domain